MVSAAALWELVPSTECTETGQTAVVDVLTDSVGLTDLLFLDTMDKAENKSYMLGKKVKILSFFFFWLILLCS